MVASLAVACSECERKVEAEDVDGIATSLESDEVGGAVHNLTSVCLNS